MNFLNNMTVKARLFMAISMFMVTLIIALAQAYLAVGANIEFAVKEKMGNAVQRPTALVLRDASFVRALLASGGDVTSYLQLIDTEMGSLRDALDLNGESLEFTDDGLGSRGRSHLKYETVYSQWEKLSQALKRNPKSKETKDLLLSFISDMRGIIAHSGDTSNLILDPDLDSYYLMDVTLLAMPQTIDRLGEIAEMFYSPLEISSFETFDSQLLKTNAAVMSKMLSESDLDRVLADMDTSFNEDKNFYDVSPHYKEKYTTYLNEYKSSSERVISNLDRIRNGSKLSADLFSQDVQKALKASGDFIGEGFNQLDTLLDLRIASYETQQMNILLISFVGVLFSMAFYILVAFSISTPLGNLNKVMMALSKHDYDVEVPYAHAHSEIGQIADSVEIFKENGLETLRLREEQKAAELRAEEEKKQMMNDLADRFDSQVGSAIASLGAEVEQLQASSRTMQSAASQSENASSSVASAAEQTSSNAATVASATEEMTASAQEISSQVGNVSVRAAAAAQSAQSTSQQVHALNALVDNIGEVVVAIKGIAEQTNLLALNATIEAARAGDAGKGFAVVADEVKKLANETAQKTEEIETRISEVQGATHEAVRAMDDIINGISEIDQASTGTASAVEEQNSVIAEITRNITEVSSAARQVAESIGTVQGAAGEAGESAKVVLHAAEDVSQLSDELQRSVQDFLNQVRAG